MVISHRFKYIFSVIPKTGSASLRNALKNYTDLGWPVTADEQHVPLHIASKLPEFPLFQEYFTFSFVRDPYDRLYSGYLQDIWASKNLEAWTKVKSPILESIDYNFSSYITQYVTSADIHNDWSWICFCPMTSFIYHNGNHLNFVGKYERFEQEVERLSELLKVPIEITEKLNVRDQIISERKYISNYTADALACINELYKEDFERFDYAQLDPSDFPAKIGN